MRVDSYFPRDIGAFVTIQEAVMKLRTIGIISTLALGLLAAPLPTEAQQTNKVYRIGYLSSRPGLPATNSTVVALLQGLRELGYVEGQNLVLEYRYGKTKNRPNWLPIWYGSRLMSLSSRMGRHRFLLRRGQPARSLSSWRVSMLILLRLDLSSASQGPVAISRG